MDSYANGCEEQQPAVGHRSGAEKFSQDSHRTCDTNLTVFWIQVITYRPLGKRA